MYVGITKQLVQEVRSTLHTLRAAELNAINGHFGETSEIEITDEEWLLQPLWGPILYPLWKEGKLDKDLEYPGVRKIQVMVDGYNGPLLQAQVRHPPKHRFVDDKSYYLREVVVKTNKDADPRLAKRLEHIAETAAIAARWNKVEAQVIDFLGSAKSLNEALQLWENLAQYVPQKYLDRVAQKGESRKGSASLAAEKLKAMDMDTINQSTVIARMSR